MPAEETPVTPVLKADAETLLLTETLMVGLIEPSVWEHFWQRKYADIKRRIDEYFDAVGQPIPVGGGVGTDNGIDPGEPGAAQAVGD